MDKKHFELESAGTWLISVSRVVCRDRNFLVGRNFHLDRCTFPFNFLPVFLTARTNSTYAVWLMNCYFGFLVNEESNKKGLELPLEKKSIASTIQVFNNVWQAVKQFLWTGLQHPNLHSGLYHLDCCGPQRWTLHHHIPNCLTHLHHNLNWRLGWLQISCMVCSLAKGQRCLEWCHNLVLCQFCGNLPEKIFLYFLPFPREFLTKLRMCIS